MTVLPKQLAMRLQKTTSRYRSFKLITDVSSFSNGEHSFYCHCHDGEILRVCVTEYKAPLR